MTKLSLLPALILLTACEKEVELSSFYCSEISPIGSGDAVSESQLASFDRFFEELQFEPDDHMGSLCVKSYWGRDSKATDNTCTNLTIVTSYGRNNIKNDELDRLLSDEVVRAFKGDFAISNCAVPYGFAITGWPDVDSRI